MENSTEPQGHFVLSRHYFASFMSDEGEEPIVIELRANSLDQFTIFSIVKGKVIRSQHLVDFVGSLPELKFLEIPHQVELLWNEKVLKADLIEVFRSPEQAEEPDSILFGLNLKIGDTTYSTTSCDTLQDAIVELQSMIGEEVSWFLRTCYDCYYSGHARFYATSDREYWCYRDVSGFSEWRSQWKHADTSMRFSGDFYISAFHTCAAWQPFKDTE